MSKTAVFYPLKPKGGQWGRNYELLYSLRSIDRFLEDDDYEVFIGTRKLPAWIDSVKVRYVQAPGYVDCLKSAAKLTTQGFDRILWMNDDNYLAAPVSPSGPELMTALHTGPLKSREAPIKNGWCRKRQKLRNWLVEQGIEPPIDFSTHSPYLYETGKFAQCLERLKSQSLLRYKIAVEVAYFNLYLGDRPTRRAAATRLSFPKPQTPPLFIPPQKWWMNFQAHRIQEPAVRGWLSGLFPNPSRFELPRA